MNAANSAPVEARKPFTASNSQIWMWALGGIAAHAMICTFGQSGTIYIVGFGVSAALVSWAHMIPRILDSILDPILGHWSDNTHTRWGRRKPFMIGGSVMGALMLVAVWWANPHWGEWTKFLHLLVFGTACYLCYGLYSMTWTALGFELSDDYNERSRVQAYAGLILTVVLLMNSWIYWLALRPMFGDGKGSPYLQTGLAWFYEFAVRQIQGDPSIKANEVAGMRWVSAVIGVLIIVSALVACFFVKERFTHANVRKHEPILPALRKAVKNRPFLVLLIYKSFQLFGERVYGGVCVYLNIFYVCAGNKELATKIGGLAGMIGAFWGIAIVPFIKPLSQKFGKRGGLVFGSSVVFVTAIIQPLLMNPRHPYLMLIPALLTIPVIAISNTMLNAIVPDICDLDELQTGERREGLFTAVMGFIAKMEISATIVIVGYLLTFAGFDAKAATQTPVVLSKMYWMGIIPNILFTLAALITAIKFPMTEAMTREVHEKLATRHKAHPGDAPLS
jgi:GPH family glycoside/pentoside/hexuronide:cation symporter